MKIMRNNLELEPLAHYIERYQAADPAEIASRTKLAYSPVLGCFQLRFLGRVYRVSHPGFAITCPGSGEEAILQTNRFAQILLLRYMLEGDFEMPVGLYLPFRDFLWGDTYSRQFQSRCVDRLARCYSSDREKFLAGMDRFLALPMADGDCAYDVEVLSGFPVRFILWDGDGEFPPSAQILFSSNFLNAFWGEDLAYIVEIILEDMGF